jgi:hypothetical protein
VRSPFLPLALGLVFGLATSGCDSSSDGYIYPPNTAPANILDMDIDTGTEITNTPGKDRPAVLVEYQAGGTWIVSTTCDTTVSGYSCSWDIVLSVDAGHKLTILDDKTDLESSDRVLTVDPGAVRAIFQTESDVDPVTLQSDPGDTLQIDSLLDGNLDPGFVSWSSGGENTNSGSNPIQLTPTSP